MRDRTALRPRSDLGLPEKVIFRQPLSVRALQITARTGVTASRLFSVKIFVEELYSDGDIRVYFLNCKEKYWYDE